MFPAFRCNYSWFTTGRSSPAHVAAFPGLPRSATGRIPFGRPVSSSRTLTTGLWINGPGPTALCWEDAGRWLPAPGYSSGWRRRIYTCHIIDVARLVYAIRTYCFPTLGHGSGFCLGPAYPRPGPKLHAQPILDRLGCVSQKRTLNPDEGPCPTLCLTTTDCRKLTTYRRLYCDFDRSIFANNFHSSSLKSIENFYSRLTRLFSATAKRGRGRDPSAERGITVLERGIKGLSNGINFTYVGWKSNTLLKVKFDNLGYF